MTGPEPREVWSLNLSGLKFYLSLLIAVATVITIALSAATVVGQHIFDKELDRFHEKAVPEIGLLIDAAIAQHRAEAVLEYTVNSKDLERQLAVIEEKLAETDRRIARIEVMLERIYNERFNRG